MPRRGRARRVAARQTQLGQRKKRHTGGPETPYVAVESPVTRPERPDGAPEDIPPQAPTSRPAAATVPTQTRHAEPRAAVYNYVGPELRRILGFSSGFIVVLIALTFVLR